MRPMRFWLRSVSHRISGPTRNVTFVRILFSVVLFELNMTFLHWLVMKVSSMRWWFNDLFYALPAPLR